MRKWEQKVCYFPYLNSLRLGISFFRFRAFKLPTYLAKKYCGKKKHTGGNKWYSSVFRSDFDTVAIAKKKYELLRFWLLGTWIAHGLNLDFYLVNLVLSESEKTIEHLFRPHIKENEHRKFLRTKWEDIYHVIQDTQMSAEDKDTISKYFEEKTLGYDSQGRVQKAFSIPQYKRSRRIK